MSLSNIAQSSYTDQFFPTALGGKHTQAYFSSKPYLDLSAVTKQSQLWYEIEANPKHADWPGIKLAEIFLESMAPSFTQKGDAFAINFWGGSARKKLIHSVGAVAKVELIPAAGNPFTGIFKGAKNGLMRLSSAVDPTSDNSALAPGLGLKFLRDGMDSANLVAMYSINGNPKGDFNFFSQDFTNHVSKGTSTSTELLVKKFSTETQWCQDIGLSEFATYDESGAKEANPVFPYLLHLVPNRAQVTNNETSYFLDQLKGVPADVVVYEMFGWDKPEKMGGKLHPIGSLKIDGQFKEGYFGDQTMFIRHQLFDDDLKIHPEWAQYTEKCTTSSKKCPFAQTLEEIGLY